MERTREMGILRACGAQPAQVGEWVLLESGLSGFMAGLLALPLGWGLAWVLIQVVNARSFGWTYDILSTPAPLAAILAQTLALATLAAAIAGIFPALRASNTHIPSALDME